MFQMEPRHQCCQIAWLSNDLPIPIHRYKIAHYVGAWKLQAFDHSDLDGGCEAELKGRSKGRALGASTWMVCDDWIEARRFTALAMIIDAKLD